MEQKYADYPKICLNYVNIINAKGLNIARDKILQDASYCPQSCCYNSVFLVLCCCKMVTLVSLIVPVVTIASIIHFIDKVLVKK